MKFFIPIIILFLLFSCTSIKENNVIKDQVFRIVLQNANTKEIVSDIVTIDEIKITTFENIYWSPRVTMTISRDNFKYYDEMDNYRILSFLMDDIMLSRIFIGSGFYTVDQQDDVIIRKHFIFKINNEIVDVIKNINNINISEEYIIDKNNFPSFTNSGDFNNIFIIDDNYISTLYSILNMNITDIYSFLDDNTIYYDYRDYSRGYLRKTYALCFSISNSIYIEMHYDDNHKEGKYAEMILFSNTNKNFITIFPKLLREIGDPNNADTNLLVNRAIWDFNNISISFHGYSDEGIQRILILIRDRSDM